MGVDYYIVCEERKEVFDLGRNGPWSDLRHLIEEKELRRAVIEHMIYLTESVDGKLRAKKAGNMVVGWCKERDWKVRIMSDADEEYEKMDVDKWLSTGDLYAIPSPTLEELRTTLESRAEALLEEFGLDSIKITATTEDTPLFDHIPLLGWEIEAETAYDHKRSGFKRIQIDRIITPSEEDEDDRRR